MPAHATAALGIPASSLPSFFFEYVGHPADVD